MLTDQLNVLDQFEDTLPVAGGSDSYPVQSDIVHMTEVSGEEKACLTEVVQIPLEVDVSQQVLCI